MNEKLSKQKSQLRQALAYAQAIEDCDTYIADGIHTEYYRAVRQEAVTSYADAMAAIIESSIDIAVEFEAKKKSFDQRLLEEINSITNDYKTQLGL